MFESVGGAWSTMIEHPYIGVALFLVISAGVVFLFSGGNWLASVSGLFRVFFTIFTTPFVFLRDALSIIRAAGESERDYSKTRVFLLFRYSRIQYLAILIGALLVLSAGITMSVLTFYPSAELDRQRDLQAQIGRLQTDIETTNTTVTAASAPDFRRNLETTRTEALGAYQRQVRSNAVFLEDKTFRGDIITQLLNARNVDAVARVRGRLDAYMSTCPNNYTWRNFTLDDCARFRAFVLELAGRKDTEFNLGQAYVDAESALRGAESALREANERLGVLQSDLAAAKQQRDAVSLMRGEWIAPHAWAAFTVLLSSLFSVIVFVWFGAIAADVLNWLILMMRSLEKSQSEKLERASAEYQA